MRVYTVLEPPEAAFSLVERTRMIRFLKEGFSLFALIAPPLWMLIHRLWLALILYIGTLLVIDLTLEHLAIDQSVRLAVEAGLSLLIGLEAANIRRLSMELAGWREVGAVVAANIDEAEARFFVPWSADLDIQPASSRAASAPARVMEVFSHGGARR